VTRCQHEAFVTFVTFVVQNPRACFTRARLSSFQRRRTRRERIERSPRKAITKTMFWSQPSERNTQRAPSVSSVGSVVQSAVCWTPSSRRSRAVLPSWPLWPSWFRSAASVPRRCGQSNR